MLSHKEKTLEAAIEYAHHATELANAAVQKHILLGPVEEELQKLVMDKDATIEAIEKRHQDDVAEVYRKAGISPDTAEL